MKIVEITKSKVDKMSGMVEDMLLTGGELMHCLTELEDEMYGERGHDGMMNRYTGEEPMYGERSRSYSRRGYDDMYGERRRGYSRMR